MVDELNITMMVMEAVETALEALFFGSVWYFGILIFIILSIAIMKMWKYAVAIIFPFIIAMEVNYYTLLSTNAEFAWAMLSLLMLAVFMAGYAVLHKGE